MSYNTALYWNNFLNQEKEFEVKANSLILEFSIAHQGINEIYRKWLAFPDEESLLGFMKYVVLPSGYYSRLFGEVEEEIFIEADSYDEVMELLENNNHKKDLELIKAFDTDYRLLEEIEADLFSIEKLKEVCKSFNAHLDHDKVVFATIEVYESINEVGAALVNDYEEEGLIEELEEQMGLKRVEIENLFSSIDQNPFMLKRITEYLNNKLCW